LDDETITSINTRLVETLFAGLAGAQKWCQKNAMLQMDSDTPNVIFNRFCASAYVVFSTFNQRTNSRL